MCFANSVAINLKLIQNLPLSLFLDTRYPSLFLTIWLGFLLSFRIFPWKFQITPPPSFVQSHSTLPIFHAKHGTLKRSMTFSQKALQVTIPTCFIRQFTDPLGFSSSIQRSPSNCFFFSPKNMQCSP